VTASSFVVTPVVVSVVLVDSRLYRISSFAAMASRMPSALA
jgi:hypothetical protein